VTRIRALPGAFAGALGRGLRAIADAGRALVEPLRPEADTTEASVYFGLILIAAAFVAAGDLPKALGVPGTVITILGSAPVIAALLRRS
jgi:hypothetical protein